MGGARNINQRTGREGRDPPQNQLIASLAGWVEHRHVNSLPFILQVFQQFRGIAGLDLASLGIPSEAEYVRSYCKRTNRKAIDASHWDFYLAYNLFRIAAILQGILKRVVDGTAASAHARDAGSRARPMAELGWQQVEKILRRAA